MLQIIRARRDAGSLPGNRADSATLALTVEGGGMRGAVSAAMLTYLDDAGLKNVFDVVYGTSSGAINSAYFVSQETWYPLSIYFEDLTTRQFVNYYRALRRQSILNLEYIFEHVLGVIKPLDYQAVIDSPIPLIVSATDVDALETVTFRSFSSVQELEAILRAGVWLPIAVRGSMKLHGRRFIDGGVLTPLPFRLAMNDGCTHILSLSTQRIRRPPTRVPGVHRYVAIRLDRIRRGLGRGYLNAVRQRYRDEEWLTQRRFTPESGAPYVLDLAPLPWMSKLELNELESTTVLAGIQESYALCHCAIESLDSNRIRDRNVRALPRMTIVHPAQRQTGAAIRR
ncbi:patatin-like phospholipase family protein [Nocardia sp. NPDC051787]|uniref:patatin-like phospholipase family protein n=1 Tax=Nocardia sp. NPDC051787 TaxID=3155415 RepID=UPI003446FBC1